MRAVLGLLLLFGGAELMYLVVSGKLTPAGNTGGGPDAQPAAAPAANSQYPAAPQGIQLWGTHAAAKGMS